MADGNLILEAGALLAAGLVASFIAVRVLVPSLLLFLGLGMLVGSEALGWISFDNYRLARTIGVISLALILFEGGLTSGLLDLRPVLGPAVALATVGTAITAIVVGLSAAALFGFTTKEGLLLGAILSSTDGAAIFALLRGSTLSRKLRRLDGSSAHARRAPRGECARMTGIRARMHARRRRRVERALMTHPRRCRRAPPNRPAGTSGRSRSCR
ncbi:MAG TPA: cation:proton antiporter [Solirubrobacteraceae bacterium]